MEPKGSLLFSGELPTCSCPEPDDLSLWLPIALGSILIVLSSLHRSSPCYMLHLTHLLIALHE